MLTLLWTEATCLLEKFPLVGLTLIALVAVMVYYQLVVVRPVILHCKPGSPFNDFLRSKLAILQELYWPTFWCFEPRCQTILASFVRSTLSDIKYRREVRRNDIICLHKSMSNYNA